LATNAIEFMVHPKQGRPRYQTVKPGGNPSTVTITCPDCGTEHIVAHVAETIGVADNSALS
jgi:RNase P subunit RPR2